MTDKQCPGIVTVSQGRVRVPKVQDCAGLLETCLPVGDQRIKVSALRAGLVVAGLKLSALLVALVRGDHGLGCSEHQMVDQDGDLIDLMSCPFTLDFQLPRDEHGGFEDLEHLVVLVLAASARASMQACWMSVSTTWGMAHGILTRSYLLLQHQMRHSYLVLECQVLRPKALPQSLQ